MAGRKAFDREHDTGFTLVEVIVAISLLLIVAVAASGFTIQGIKLAAQQQRAQVAVTVANQAMEGVQRLTGSNAQAVTLVAGRTAASVATAWTAMAGVDGLAQTYRASDASATSASTQTIPVTSTVTQNGTDYTATVLIGTCYQPSTGGTCTTLSGYATDPGTAAPAGYSQLIRSIVVVDYVGTCTSTGTCRYTTMSLFDTKGDLTWQTGA